MAWASALTPWGSPGSARQSWGGAGAGRGGAGQGLGQRGQRLGQAGRRGRRGHSRGSSLGGGGGGAGHERRSRAWAAGCTPPNKRQPPTKNSTGKRNGQGHVSFLSVAPHALGQQAFTGGRQVDGAVGELAFRHQIPQVQVDASRRPGCARPAAGGTGRRPSADRRSCSADRCSCQLLTRMGSLTSSTGVGAAACMPAASTSKARPVGVQVGRLPAVDRWRRLPGRAGRRGNWRGTPGRCRWRPTARRRTASAAGRPGRGAAR